MGNTIRRVQGSSVQAREVGSIHVGMSQGAPTTALNGLAPCVSSFTGRTEELAVLAAHRVCVVSGLGGIGKTELVHRYAEITDFPGGRLFYDFHGYDESKRTNAPSALAFFLQSLGVTEVPVTEAARSALYRSLVADRPHMLIVLDNVISAAQIRPLLVAKHQVVVTSRHLLTGVDAHQLELDVLPAADAEQIVGDAEIARLCGRLPLALHIMAALRQTDPDNDWAEELRETRLGLLQHDDLDLRAAFDLSYRALTDEQRQFFRLVAMHRMNEITPETAAAFADRSVPRARTLLRDLRTAHLLGRGNQYHDLVQDFADDLRDREDSVETVLAAGTRFYELVSARDWPEWRLLVWGAISKTTSGHVDARAFSRVFGALRDKLDWEFLQRLTETMEATTAGDQDGTTEWQTVRCNGSCGDHGPALADAPKHNVRRS